MERTWIVAMLLVGLASEASAFVVPTLPTINIGWGKGKGNEVPKVPEVQKITTEPESNGELFGRYRCQLCKDIAVDNIQFIDGGMKLNENFAVKLCDKILGPLNRQVGYLVCHAVIKSKLDGVLNKVGHGTVDIMGEALCKRLQFCY